MPGIEDFLTVADAEAAALDPLTAAVRTAGHAAPGDGGESVLVETDRIEPGGFQDAAGRFFEVGRRPVYCAAQLGVLPDDPGAAANLNSAMEWLWRKRGGGAIAFLPGRYLISETVLNQYNNVALLGAGNSWYSNVGAFGPDRWDQFGGTRFKWVGGAGKMVVFRPKVDPAGAALVGCSMDGIVLDADGIATHCLEILSVHGGRFPKLVCADATEVNLHIGVVAPGDISPTEPRDLQHCDFGTIFTKSLLPQSLGAIGTLIDGDNLADSSVNRFGEIHYIHKDGVGLELRSSDCCRFDLVEGWRAPGGTAIGTKFTAGSGTADYPRKHHFSLLQPGPGGLVACSGAQPPRDIVIDCYSLGNGSPIPVVAPGAAVSYKTDTGTLRVMSAFVGPIYDIFVRADAAPAGGVVASTVAYAKGADGVSKAWSGIIYRSVSLQSNAELGAVDLNTIASGVWGARVRAQNGIFAAGAPGGDPGAGKINAIALCKNGVPV